MDAGYSAQDDYNAVAWLANDLLANLSSSTLQIDISYAIWTIFDPGLKTINGQSANGPDGGVSTLITKAFNQVVNGHFAPTNVTVYTPTPTTASQEYLVVNAPLQTPEPPGAAVLSFDLMSAIAAIYLVRRYRASAWS